MFNSYYYNRYRPHYRRWHDYDYWYHRPYYDYPSYWYNDRYSSINQRINNFGYMSDVWQSGNINYF